MPRTQGQGEGDTELGTIPNSVADPDPYVFGLLASFYHQAKIVRKTLIAAVLLLLFDFLSLKNDVNVPSKSNKQKIFLSAS